MLALLSNKYAIAGVIFALLYTGFYIRGLEIDKLNAEIAQHDIFAKSLAKEYAKKVEVINSNSKAREAILTRNIKGLRDAYKNDTERLNTAIADALARLCNAGANGCENAEGAN